MKTTTERFMEKVSMPAAEDGCWVWVGARTYNEYGRFSHEGRVRQATQVSWELHHGRRWPEGMLACHTCDNPPCVNPAHIFPGTHLDNARDMIAKGRQQNKGVCKRGHPMTDDNIEVRIIRGYRTRFCLACRKVHQAAGRTRRNEIRRQRYAASGNRP
jgi:hypothetical protein